MKSSLLKGIILSTLSFVAPPIGAQDLPAARFGGGTEISVLKGAGATLPAPLYEKWISVFEESHPRVRIGYDAVGSGEGIRRFIGGEVDFGASDAAMRDEEIAQVKRGVVLTPTTGGMVVLAYNLPGVKGQLKLTRDVYPDIFSRKVTEWDDPRIKASNPELALPHKSIAVVARQDSSGTTYAFTNHLSAINPKWRDSGPGVGKVVGWPGGVMAARGNEGVASRIKISDGSIGYLEYFFAKRLDLPMASLENRAGRFVGPSAQSGREALQNGSATMPSNMRIFIPDPDGENSYPIVTYSWFLLYGQYADASVASNTKEFVSWTLGEGQQYNADLGYIPLPESVAAQARTLVDGIRP